MGQSGSQISHSSVSHSLPSSTRRRKQRERRQRSADSSSSSSSSDSSEEAAPQVDRLASATKTGVLLEVMTPQSACPWHPQREPPKIKNILTEDWQYAEITDKTVLLHVYDLAEFGSTNELLAFTVDEVTLGGAFHTGVEVFGNEWSYGTLGVRCEAPRTAEGHTYRCSVPLGNTSLTQLEVAEVIHDLCQTWKATDYDIFSRNCCSFAAEVCKRLGCSDFPPWVDRFARMASVGRKVSHGAMRVSQGAIAVGMKVGGLLNQGLECIVEAWNEDTASREAWQQGGGTYAGQVPTPVRHSVVERVGSRARRSKKDGSRKGLHAGQLPPTRQGVLEGGDTAEPYPWVPPQPVQEAARSSTSPCVAAAALEETLRADAVAAFPTGAEVEYNSASKGWILAKVLHYEVSSGLYDLDCKPQVPLEKIRWPLGNAAAVKEASGAVVPVATITMDVGTRSSASSSSSSENGADSEEVVEGSAFPIGSNVEYESASHGRWIAAKVLGFDPATGSYDLDCREAAAPERMRWPLASQGSAEQPSFAADMEGASPVAALSNLPRTSANASCSLVAASGSGEFAAGCAVEYESASHGWIMTKVVTFHSSSAVYDLECKQQVPPEKIRWPRPVVVGTAELNPERRVDGTSGLGGVIPSTSNAVGKGSNVSSLFPIGAAVEYESASHGRWVPAKVLAFNSTSALYDLDCKPQVPPDKVRWPVAVAANKDALSLTATSFPIGAVLPAFPVGATVEYQSASTGRWISAKVLAYDAAASLYDLDCKAQAMPARIRWPAQADSALAVVAAAMVAAKPAVQPLTICSRPELELTN